MIEAPDKRVWLFFVPAFIVAALYMVVPSEAAASRIIEAALYFTFFVLGAGIGVLSLMGGYSLLHPSSTRQERVFLYWSEIMVCLWFAGVAVWKLVGVLRGAG